MYRVSSRPAVSVAYLLNYIVLNHIEDVKAKLGMTLKQRDGTQPFQIPPVLAR